MRIQPKASWILALLGLFLLPGCTNLPLEDWRWDDGSRRWLWAHAPLKSEPRVSEEKWGFNKKAVNLRLEAVQRLNSYNDESHTIVVKLFQLSDPSSFNKYIKTPSGIRHLLVSESSDPSVLYVDSLVVEPNDSKHITIDRQEGAKFIGVVAGFVSLSPKTVTRVIPIVGVEDREDKFIVLELIDKVFGGDAEIRPAKLDLEMWFGSDGIEKAIVKAS